MDAASVTKILLNQTIEQTKELSSDSSDVLIMSVSAIVPEKSRGNKKCDEEEGEELRHIFGLFRIAVKWP